MRTLALAALAALLAVPALAQDGVVLRPGHPDLMTAGLDVNSETVGLRVTQPRQRELGTVSTVVERDGDRVVLTTDADAPQAGQQYEVTATFRFPTLAPVRRERSTARSRGTTDYDGAMVSGEHSNGEWAPIPFDITLPREVFQPEVLPIIVRALPFEEGYTAVVPTFTSESRVVDYTLTVTGMEDFERADGSTVSAWVVAQTASGTRPPGPRTYYVDPESRALVASTTTATGNAVIVSEPVTEEALAALSAEAATPAVALRPGLDRLETETLDSYSRDYDIRVVEPVQQDAGTMSRTLTVDEAAGTVTLEVATEIAIAGQRTSETLVAAYPSLAPISNVTDANGTIVDLDYADGSVTGSRTPADGEAETIDLPVEAPVYDGGWLFEIVRLLPFADGYRAVFHTVSPTEGPTEVMLAVVDQEEIDGQTAWIVEATPEGGAPTEFAVADGTRELVRVRLLPQPGVVVDFVPTDGAE